MTIRIVARGLAAAGLAGLLALSFLLGLGASPAHAQLPEVPDLLPEDPAPEDPLAPEDPAVPDAPEGTDLIGDLLGEGLLDPDDLLELGDLLDLNPDDLLGLQLDELLEMLNLEDLLGLLDLLGEDPAPDPVPADPTPTPPPPAAQVTEVPRGGVATGAGGASDTGAAGTAPLVLASLLLAGVGGGHLAARRWFAGS